MKLTFVGYIASERITLNTNDVSNASNIFQRNVIKALSPDCIISIYPLPCFKLNVDINDIESNSEIKILNGRNIGIKSVKILFDILDTYRNIKFKSDVIIYSLNIQTVFVFWLLKIFKNSNVYIIVADLELPVQYSSFFRRLLQRFINYSMTYAKGLLVLNSNIKMNTNTVVCNGLIDVIPYNLIESPKTDEKYILFSGSIDFSTGIDVAIRAMDFLPQYTLVICGKIYGDNESEVLALLKTHGLKNVLYLGNVVRQEYLNLVSKCSIALSLKDMSLVSNQYNFPSKLLELLYFNKYVIGCCNYVDFPENYITTELNVMALVNAVKSCDLQNEINSREFILRNYSFNSFRSAVNDMINY
jgi:glycosyltransferase involved in cell wall biosynthesis